MAPEGSLEWALGGLGRIREQLGDKWRRLRRPAHPRHPLRPRDGGAAVRRGDGRTDRGPAHREQRADGRDLRPGRPR
ncbi:MAG: hypothetical protein U5R31_10210 [Acidimicrobiia bacterium]|nr:hypothetical protein [Acidimicrobiia bacterium]